MIWLVFQILAFLVWVAFASLLACPLFWYHLIRDLIAPAKLRWPSAKSTHGKLPGQGDPLSQPLVRYGAAAQDSPSEDGEQGAGPGMAEAGKEVRPSLPASASAEASSPAVPSRHLSPPRNPAACPPVATSWKSFFTLAPPQNHAHLAGIPRRVVLSTVGAFSLLVTSVLSRPRIKNMERLVDAIRHRPPGTPLITISNHMSTLDDPLMWGIWGLRATDPYVCRWTLTAEDICFTNPVFSYFFRLGKCVPVKRGGGIQQATMQEAVELVNDGEWLHTFPEGRIVQDRAPIQRLKWGTGSIIAKASVNPIILPVAHSGFETIMPEKWLFGRRAVFPLPYRRISVVVGEPFMFDLTALKKAAEASIAEGRPTPSSPDSPTAQILGRGANFANEGTSASPPKPEPKFEPKPTDEEDSSSDDTQGDEGDEEAAGQRLLQNVAIIREPADELPPDPSLPPLPEEVWRKAKAARNPSAETAVDVEDPEKVKAKKLESVGDATTRWLYAHLTEHMRRRLNDVVMQAHEMNKA